MRKLLAGHERHFHALKKMRSATIPILLSFILLLQTAAAQAQDIKITGKVTGGSSPAPIPGVTITVKGTARGTVTNPDGTYTISAPANATLVASFIGFSSKEIPVNNQTTIDINSGGIIFQIIHISDSALVVSDGGRTGTFTHGN